MSGVEAAPFVDLSLSQTNLVGGVVAVIVIVLSYYLLQFLKKDYEAAEEYSVTVPEQCQADWGAQAEVLDSPSLQIPGSTAIQCYCPANGRSLGRVNPSTAEGIDRAVSKALKAQAVWSKTTFAQRRKVLKTLLNYVLTHQEEIATVACLDSGKTRVDASFGEILVTAEKLSWTIKHGEKALRPESRPTNLLMCYKQNEVRYEPLGLVAACVSWNYPVLTLDKFHNLLNPIISSIFAGNAIIVKASEATAWSSQFFTSIVHGALTACGHLPALVQNICCWPTVAPALTSHPLISHITFIGSRAVAKHVAASAASTLTPVCAELGGKDAAIILDDAVSDLAKIASILMRGVFQSAGQNCIGIERVVALPRAYDGLLQIIPPRVSALRVGSALDDEEHVDVGACISAANFDNLEHLIADAVSRGAQLLHGGTRLVHPDFPKGHYFSPTLLANVTPDMPIAQRELFAPVFVLMRANDVSDAISMANSTPYSLGCSVFGASARDLERVTTGVRAGMVAVNDFATYYMCGMPFGGVAGSGYGRFGGEEGLRSLCNLKSVCRDRFPALASTSIPPRLDYPLPSRRATRVSHEDEKGVTRETGNADADANAKAKAWGFTKGIVNIGYGVTLTQRIDGIRNILVNM